mmetsp:Transcript_86183/g.267767  ORF Transcript_86183/g.267767 Transcript_86183/m.267767 type:complete len:150 (-) Transcript_86183:48-497(-)
MLQVAGRLLTQILAWADGCSCHQREHGENTTKHTRLAAYWRQLGLEGKAYRCSLSTTRAFEMPGVVLVTFIEDLARTSVADMIGMHTVEFDDHHRSVILDDFNARKEFILANVRVLLAPWLKRPLLLCGVAHPDHSQAFQQFQAARTDT